MDALTHDPLRALVTSAIRVAPAVAISAMREARERAAALPGLPPAWLEARHHALLGRVLHGLRCYGSALLAAPTGHGKTWVALAAHHFRAPGPPDVPACVIGPAALRTQWRQVARTLNRQLEYISHEKLSRGGGVLPTRTLIIVDEAHRFRSPAIRRHRHLADALVGRSALLLTATPVVNRLDDLLSLLLLTLPDDCLARDGVPSLQRLLGAGRVHPALAHLVHLPDAGRDAGPRVLRRSVTPPLDATRAGLLRDLDQLGIARDGAVAGLIRGTFERALASSSAACRSVLQRYARLLAHADDAARAGRLLSRAELLRWTSGLDDQLLLWSLLPDPEAPADLVLADAARLPAMLASIGNSMEDVAALLRIIGESRAPTIVFTAWRATARALVEQLGPRAAWCTGSGSGIGRVALPRDAVLGHFRTDRPVAGAPQLLIATDVAAEGLDLVRLRRVIHADLPWTPARLEQREGRARRAGSAADEIEVVTLRPPPELESRLRQDACLGAKSAAIARVAKAAASCAWSLQLHSPAPVPAADAAMIAVLPDTTAVRTPTALCAFENEQGHLAVAAVRPTAPPIEEPDELNALLAAAGRLAHATPHPGDVPEQLCDAVVAELRRRLAMRVSGDWLLDPADADARQLAARLQALARVAVQSRDLVRLELLDRAIRWCSRGRSSADRALAHRLLTLDASALPDALASAAAAGRFLAPVQERTPQLRLVAALCFIPSAPAATFGACRIHAPSSSISTARSSTASASSSTATIMSSASTA